ncbi:SRPBCC domain-containing protein [Hyphomicrobium sp.]|uniref:SRPBCC domain-containing protein n=1 Tax=Hyphomicrobium sp. TaxID=82 RepID=UPI000F94AE31|nr:SRPBCC domain-containing protein [Hyphomicrobium sp.]RUP08622.1 MAG: pyridoxamine 5'-phosphate oxidase [Hyphomicrobium sp.]
MASDRRGKLPSLAMVRRIESPAADVFRAWTQPDLIAQWLAPGSCVVNAVSIDLREGGQYSVDGNDPMGEPYQISGHYCEIVESRRIVMTWCYSGAAKGLKGPPSLVIADLRPLGDTTTELTVTHEKIGTPYASDLYKRDWLTCLENLSSILQPHVRQEGPSKLAAVNNFYTDGHRKWQDEFGIRALADRLRDSNVKPALTASDAAFIAHQNMFFLATVDAQGRPSCSYKGGARGFVGVLNETTLVFPSYDGSGMYLSVGNLTENPNVALLFIDFERQARLRVSGMAEAVTSSRLLKRYPGAELLIRVHIRTVFANCPRYIHKMELKEESGFVPDKNYPQPVAEWKRLAEFADVLPEKDSNVAGEETDVDRAMNRD